MMWRQTFKCGAVLVCVVLAGLTAWARDSKEDKGKPALSGAWVQKKGILKLEFSDKDVLKIHPHGDKAALVIVCSYTVDKDGLVKAKVTDYEGNVEFKEKVKEQIPVGLEFGFTWKATDGSATLGDVKCEKTDILKSHLEGDYEKK